ncbi:hypothetical protein ACMFMF_010540 [Clarireedia jacksonii]
MVYTGSDVDNGMFYHKTPTVTTDPNRLEEQAKSKLAATAYNYVAGGAGERATMDANRLAFRQWKMVGFDPLAYFCLSWNVDS